MAKLTISADVRGNFKRDIGWKLVNGKPAQQRFYLGRDRSEAVIRSVNLEKVWASVVGRSAPGQRPLWSDVSLVVGKGIADGLTEIEIAPSEDLDPVALVEWLEEQQAAYPFVLLRLPPDLAVDHEEGREALDMEVGWVEAEISELQSKAQALKGRPASGQTLHQALDGYLLVVKAKHSIGDRLSAFAVAERNRVTQLKDHSTNIPLAGFNLSAIDLMLLHWSNRPLTKRKTPASVKTCRENIKLIRRFIKWLHREPSFKWRKPEDYEVTKVNIRVTHEEVSKLSPNQLPTFTLDELGTIWRYADPFQTVYLLLGLNCGFGIGEINTLRLSEVHLDKGTIERVRFKNKVYAEWKLWSETIEALRAYLAVRPKSKLDECFISKDGLPYTVPTKGSNANWHVSHSWARLYVRLRRDQKTFRKLSFNKLRKTAANNIRRLSDGETASLFLAHGKPVSDDLLAAYSDRHFEKVFQAIDRFGEQLRPFLSGDKLWFPSVRIGEGKSKKLRELLESGKGPTEIARELGISDRTVRRHCGKK